MPRALQQSSDTTGTLLVVEDHDIDAEALARMLAEPALFEPEVVPVTTCYAKRSVDLTGWERILS